VGSRQMEDARALLALVRRREPEDREPLGEGRMRRALQRLERGVAADSGRDRRGSGAAGAGGAGGVRGAAGLVRRRRGDARRDGRPGRPAAQRADDGGAAGEASLAVSGALLGRATAPLDDEDFLRRLSGRPNVRRGGPAQAGEVDVRHRLRGGGAKMRPATPAGRGPVARSVTGAGDAPALPASCMAEGRSLRPKASQVGRVPGAPAPREDTIRATRRSGSIRWRVDVHVIERARILRGWTQADLSQEAHVDPKTIRNMISGNHRPTFGTLQALRSVLGLALADLIVFSDVGTQESVTSYDMSEHGDE
jgi:DNA-binding XRE family transcriptional regulator